VKDKLKQTHGKRHWLHGTSNDKWTHFFPHAKRGTEAMNKINILPHYHGILCHDHWKPYYKYDCTHLALLRFIRPRLFSAGLSGGGHSISAFPSNSLYCTFHRKYRAAFVVQGALRYFFVQRLFSNMP
jgi:hypothetical protein